jgi:hypothetical protein
MPRLPLLLVLLTVLGCASGLGNPVVADTGTAEARDGYEAALATVESQGYLVAINDRRRHHLRVLAKPTSAGESSVAYFDIQAMPGAVGIFVETPGRRGPREAEARELRHQMEQLAWRIGGRARILGGELSSPSRTGLPVMNALP